MNYIRKDDLDDRLLKALVSAFNRFKDHGLKSDLLIGVDSEGEIDIVDLDFDAPAPLQYHNYKWFASIGTDNDVATVANYYCEWGSDYYTMDGKDLDAALNSFKNDPFDDGVFNSIWENTDWELTQFLRCQDNIEVVE